MYLRRLIDGRNEQLSNCPELRVGKKSSSRSLSLFGLKFVLNTDKTDCSGQDEQLSLVFTISSMMATFLILPNGFFFDHFGTMATRILAILVFTTGSLLIAFSSAELSVLIFPAYCCLHISNLFGSYRPIIITLLSGSTMSGPVVFLIIKILHERGISLRSSFLFISACSVIHLLRTFLLMPKTHIPYPLPEGYTYGMVPEGAETTESSGIVQRERGAVPQAGDTQPPENTAANVMSFRSCALSWFFLSHLVWVCAIQLNVLFIIGTLNTMLTRLTNGDPSLVSSYTNAFAFTQLCGIFCSPLNGLIIGRNKGKPRAPGETEKEADLRSSVLSLFLTALLCLLFSICASIPVLPLQYFTFVLQVLTISFLYGGHSAFIRIAFPSCHYGKLYGLVLCLSAVVLLLQFPLIILVNDVLQGNPLYVNIGLIILSLLAFLHPLYVYLHCRRQAAHRLSLNSYNHAHIILNVICSKYPEVMGPFG
ncbi:hypothetical protein AAFF_G00293540 [Aldrovandia affinis]|uniref:Solute carrier family 43 member 3 n=1 Tax=Aldrovandia affinis TaxID=143900 RepID=A0AAD7R9I1_9TELE|nr:hypothetical protein AAFF_G00293540 [Aldrovandia affinis]